MATLPKKQKNDIPKLLIATHNPGKLEQMRRHLASLPYTIVSLADLGITYDVEETGSTLHENAALKACEYARLSNLPTVADDSGLMINALDGAPGVHSARWAGLTATQDEKLAFLLSKMAAIPEGQRTAHFTSIMALTLPNQQPLFFEGHTHGTILTEPRGTGPNGLVYTRVFWVTEIGQTIAEYHDKHGHFDGHRAQASAQLTARLLKKTLF